MKIKCIDNKGNEWFKVGKVYGAWINTYGELWSESDCEVDCFHDSMNNPHGLFEIIEEEKKHQHADLMLKYAMISQYDDKPWESFEVLLDGEWKPMDFAGMHSAFKYRLKPQYPKIQLGQIWVSKEGVEVMVYNPSHAKAVYFSFDVCGYNYKNCVPISEFLQNFKLKENK